MGNLQQLAVPLAHIAGLGHEDLLGTPAQRPGAWDTWLNIIANRYNKREFKNPSRYKYEAYFSLSI